MSHFGTSDEGQSQNSKEEDNAEVADKMSGGMPIISQKSSEEPATIKVELSIEVSKGKSRSKSSHSKVVHTHGSSGIYSHAKRAPRNISVKGSIKQSHYSKSRRGIHRNNQASALQISNQRHSSSIMGVSVRDVESSKLHKHSMRGFSGQKKQIKQEKKNDKEKKNKVNQTEKALRFKFEKQAQQQALQQQQKVLSKQSSQDSKKLSVVHSDREVGKFQSIESQGTSEIEVQRVRTAFTNWQFPTERPIMNQSPALYAQTPTPEPQLADDNIAPGYEDVDEEEVEEESALHLSPQSFNNSRSPSPSQKLQAHVNKPPLKEEIAAFGSQLNLMIADQNRSKSPDRKRVQSPTSPKLFTAKKDLDLISQPKHTHKNVNNTVEHLLIQEAKQALWLEKAAVKEAKDQLRASDEDFDLSKIRSSDEYFDHVSIQIPISELYKLLMCMCNSEENEFCAILIRIECKELQNKYKGRFLLQVWTKVGQMVYQKILQYPIHRWNLNGKYLIYIQNEKEPTAFREWQQVFVVHLVGKTKTGKYTKEAMLNVQHQFQFYKPLHARNKIKIDESEFNLDTFLGFTEKVQKPSDDNQKDHVDGGYLLVSNSTHLKYVHVPDRAFQETDGSIEVEHFCITHAEVVGFKSDVRVLAITEIQAGQPCLITERLSGHLVFLALSVVNEVLQLGELNDKGVAKQKNIFYDPILKIISMIFLNDQTQQYRQCGIALHESGTLDFLWNFRVVDQFKQKNPIFTEGIVEDIYADFGFLYYRMTQFDKANETLIQLKQDDPEHHKQLVRILQMNVNKATKAQIQLARDFFKTLKVKQIMLRCCNQWKERLGSSTAFLWQAEEHDDIEKQQMSILHHLVSNFVRLYPWFSNMQTHFTICHYKFLSIFDINSQQWDHIFLRNKQGQTDQSIGGLRVCNREGTYFAGVILKSGVIRFFRADNGQCKPSDWPDAELGGEVIRIVREKRYQSYVLILVKQKFKRQHTLTAALSSSNVSEMKFKLEGNRNETTQPEKTSICLYIYTAQHYEKVLPIPSEHLSEDSELFIIPATKRGEPSFLLIDNSVERTSFFYEINSSDPDKDPDVQQMKDFQFDRPFNVSFGQKGAERNKLVGFIEQEIEDKDDQNVSIFVSRNDISVQSEIMGQRENFGEKPRITYKHFTDRNIQSILRLDSWMYTLSNTSSRIQEEHKTKPEDLTEAEKYGTKWFMKNGRNAVEPPKYRKLHTFADQLKEAFLRKSKDFNPGGDPFTGSSVETQGLYAYDLKQLANSQTLVSYKLKDAMVGVNRHIDFCNNSYRIAFLKNFDQIDLVPVPHRNTINFLGMSRKTKFYIWREVEGIFTALDIKGALRAWVIGTGKIAKSNVSVGIMDLEEFHLYECNQYDDTYKKDWQQHSNMSISLLKSKKELLYYDREEEHLLAENQAAKFMHAGDSVKPQVFMFKVITMSDSVVKEEMSFSFNYLVHQSDEDELQRLILSRDLNKLMEIFSDSRCRIYQKKTQEGKKKVSWALLYQLNKYPTTLQGLSYVSFLFSPKFTYFIDTMVNKQQFCIKSTATNKVVLQIPRKLYGFKTQSDVSKDTIRSMASRMIFISEDKIRVINKFGLDTILQLNFDQDNEPVTMKSICKIDHWNPYYCEDAHTILEPVPLESHMTIERLMRQNQRFKSLQYHLKARLDQEEAYVKLYNEIPATDEDEYFDWIKKGINKQDYYSRKLHEQLQTVDYSQDWYDDESQFVAEMNFTILDWQIIERLTNSFDNGFTIESLDNTRILQLCFNILPGVKTVLHQLVEARANLKDLQSLFLATNEYPLSQLTEKLWKSDKQNQPHAPNQKELYCTVPILEDIDGATALELALCEPNPQKNIANQILLGIETYPFMHSGFVLVPGILKALFYECPAIGQFLDFRMVVSEHLDCTSLSRKCLNPDPEITQQHAKSNLYYTTLIANPWADKQFIKNKMFVPQFERKITLRYLDIPNLYTFNDDGNKFFKILAGANSTDLFKFRSIQIIIMYKWHKLKNKIKYWQFCPHIFMLVTHLFWHVAIRPYRDGDYKALNVIFEFVLFSVVSYFFSIEVMQMRVDCASYLEDLASNIRDAIPLMTILFQILLAHIYEEGEDDKAFGIILPIFNTIGILMLWTKCLYYLRIWAATNYLAGMVIRVVFVMKWFLLVYAMSQFAFGQGFYRLSKAGNKTGHSFTQHVDDFTWASSIFYAFMLSIGNFDYKGWNSPDNPNFNLIWMVYLLCITINLIVMLNLLIAIITDTYTTIREVKAEVGFSERAEAIADFQEIIPKSWTRCDVDEQEELFSCTKLLLIAEEQEEISLLKVNEDTSESRIMKKLVNCENVLKVIKVDCGMLKYKAIMGEGIVNANRPSGLRQLSALGRQTYASVVSDKMVSLMKQKA